MNGMRQRRYGAARAGSMMRVATTLGIALALSTPGVLRAQHNVADSISADDRATHSYVLTMEHMRELKQAMTNLDAYAKANPEAAAHWMDETGGDQSIAGQIRQIDALPAIRRAITSAGLSVRDYLLTSATWFQAGVLAQVQDKDAVTHTAPPPIPYNINPANVAFMRAHRAEVEALNLGETMEMGGASGGGAR